jgi:hypothetical protein
VGSGTQVRCLLVDRSLTSSLVGGKLRTEMSGYEDEKRGPQVSREVLHCVEARLVVAGVESPREDDCQKRGPQQTTRYLRCISDLGGYWSGLEATISVALR